jgi:hypothetical protein
MAVFCQLVANYTVLLVLSKLSKYSTNKCRQCLEIDMTIGAVHCIAFIPIYWTKLNTNIDDYPKIYSS